MATNAPPPSPMSPTLSHLIKSYPLRPSSEFAMSMLNIFSTVILASHSFLQFVAFWCRSAFIVASDWFVLPI